MGRQSGAVNYNTEVLIAIVEQLLTKGAEGWKRVAVLYQCETGEVALRDHEDIKRHWVEK
jgi:hypothetical protein